MANFLVDGVITLLATIRGKPKTESQNTLARSAFDRGMPGLPAIRPDERSRLLFPSIVIVRRWCAGTCFHPVFACKVFPFRGYTTRPFAARATPNKWLGFQSQFREHPLPRFLPE